MSDRGTTVNVNVTVAATLTAGTAAALSHGGNAMDVASFATPSAYLAMTLAACIVGAVFIAVLVSKYRYDEVVKAKVRAGEIASAADLPYDYVRYGIPTVLAALIGIAAGTTYGPGFVLSELSVEGAGLGAYVVLGIVVAGLITWAIVTIAYRGVDVFITDAAKMVTDAAKAAAAVKEDAAVVKAAVAAPATDAKTEAAAVDSSSTRAQ